MIDNKLERFKSIIATNNKTDLWKREELMKVLNNLKKDMCVHSCVTKMMNNLQL